MKQTREPSKTSMREFLGIILFTISLLMMLALVSYDWKDISLLRAPPNSPPANYIGPAGAWFGFATLMMFGLAAFLVPVGAGLVGIVLVVKPGHRFLYRVLCWTAATLAAGGLLQLRQSRFEILCERFNISGITGGIFGWFAAERLFSRAFGTTGAIVLLAGLLAGCLFMFIGRDAFQSLFTGVFGFLQQAKIRINSAREKRRSRFERIAREERELARQSALIEKAVKKQQRLARITEPALFRAPAESPARGNTAPPGKQHEHPASGTEQALVAKPAVGPGAEPGIVQKTRAEKPLAATSGDQPSYKLPPLDLLEPVSSASERKIQGDFQTTARILKETLAEFGIESDVTNIEQGPVVTRYELLPAPGVRVEKISQLSNNIALTLKATSIRVQAPVPGKGVVGIEVPNAIATKVYLREILEGETWAGSNAAIPLILGKDVSGNDLVADLASMPHILIAGSTGSGKTVCINSILAGILMSRTPDQLRMMLIDPKIVEFAVYNNLPHLVVPVITDPKKVPLGLRWAINEMEKRYKLFAGAGVRTIQSYNAKPKAALEPADREGEQVPDRIPYIVIVIDELADLMSTAHADVENYIARLAQLSRAVGIHMILATQRPSVNVITGTIKANFPARVSFQVAQKVDSRTILDAGGADKLLGSGDMLILPPGSSKLVRAQGALTTDQDINAIVDFIKERSEPNYELAIKESPGSAFEGGKDDAEEPDEEDNDDELLNTAVNIIRDSKRASVSLLQRRMKIGYNRAGRLMDALEDRGIVGPARGSDPRDILIDLDNEIPAQQEQ